MTHDPKPLTIALRAALPGDEAFLYQLYCQSREEEIGAWGLESAQQEMLFKLQFTAQRRHYDLAFPGAEHSIIICNDHPAGHILVFRSERELRLVDIALLAEHRGSGIGASLVRELIGEARAAGKPLVLHVEKQNRAARLYERLGFTIAEDLGGHYRMEWRADDTIKQTGE